MSRRTAPAFAKHPGRLWLTNVDAVSAIEFALISPLFCVLLAGMIDFGGVLYTKFALNASISAGANYALINGSDASSTNGASLASTIASVVTSGSSTNWANSSVIVNNGPTVSITGAGTGTMSTSSGGTASNADSCYCPTLGASGINWGGAATCGSACTNGSLAGKFVYVAANRTYVPFFPAYGFIQSETIAANSLVQVQ